MPAGRGSHEIDVYKRQVLGTAIACYAKSAQSELASQFIRFHVLANSDTDEDQALKLKVRDRHCGLL